MKTFLEIVSRGRGLTTAEAETAMELICTHGTPPEQIAAFLAIIHTRGESFEELLGFMLYLRQQAKHIDAADMLIMDTCGTGGDHSGSFNISTAAALLLASHGVKVAKHGGKSITSQCGSADVMDKLGIQTQTDPKIALKTLKEVGFVFLLASHFNHAFSYIRQLRQVLGIRTCFNILGPLLNPTKVKRQVLGVYCKHLLMPMAKLLQQLGSEEAMVIHSHDGLDEFSLHSFTDVAHLKDGKINCYTISPAAFDLKPASKQSLQGGDATMNAEIITRVFSGTLTNQYRDIVVLNAAAGFVVANAANSFQEGIDIANHCIDTGKAIHFLHQLQQSHEDKMNE